MELYQNYVPGEKPSLPHHSGGGGTSHASASAQKTTEVTPTVTPEVTATATTTPAGAEATATQQSPVPYGLAVFATGLAYLLRKQHI